MSHHQPFQIIGFHSCSKQVGLDVLNGKVDLKSSENKWDWLANGIYFWEQNPTRALEYAIESASGAQHNKVKITVPFVIGAIVELGNCLNLIEPNSLNIVKDAYDRLAATCKLSGEPMPKNNGDNRALDCAVIKFVHQSRAAQGLPAYDSIRCAFVEGEELYASSNFSSRLHIQVCLINNDLIKGYFLPRPIATFNPYLD